MFLANVNVNLIEDNVIQINGGITINVDKNSCMWKMFCIQSSTCICENGKYLASIMDDSTINCDELIKGHLKKK